jgi:3-oxoacyl-[acyl-carrier-protein] synthase II
LDSLTDFDEVTLKEGPHCTNPALFPNTVINSPASQVSVWDNIQGFNTTISSGFTASLDAISYAHDLLAMGRVKLVYAGGVEELSYLTYYGFYALKFLSGCNPGETFINCPFDRRRNGITLGEGACLVAMESYASARQRGASILGEVLGFGYYFDPFRVNRYNPRGTGIKEAIRRCLDDAGLGAEEIDYICSNANSSQAADKIETAAVKEVFGRHAYRVPVSSIKSMVGECYSASGALAVAACLGVLREGFIPPTVNLKERDPDCDLDYVPDRPRPAAPDNILIINFSPSGSYCCMILGRCK